MPNSEKLPEGLTETQVAAMAKTIYETINFGRLQNRGEATVIIYRNAAINAYKVSQERD